MVAADLLPPAAFRTAPAAWGRWLTGWLRIAGQLLPALVLCLAASSVRGQGYSPDEAPRRMTVAEGFAVQLVAAEPLVRQPVAIEFDDRGRLWCVQYLQYPNPAGLKRVQVDRYSRTVYDRTPEPPPRGTPGSDRITILEDTNGDGVADRATDFVTGLNLASGLAFGYGGVFVLNPPYLLYYADRNRDDVPDAEPAVLLAGFGIDDAHSVANSLAWGPDGWLYGTQGSTVTANLRGHEFQQGVWRYHPLTQQFELFCEGGGNSWGLDFDAAGELLYSTNFGGYVMLHGVPGGYYWKNFGKHGALHNPHTYGYFDHVPHANFFGGHVTVGGVVYQGDLFPPEFRGRYIAADLLGHGLYWHTIAPRGSTFSSAHGGTLLAANDTWFAPSDVTVGPDGAVYVADWHDARTAHPDPDAEWDRRNGRIYRVAPRSAKVGPCRDLRNVRDEELIATLASTNEWHVRRARRVLAERKDPRSIPPLTHLALAGADQSPGGAAVAARTSAPREQLALEALWALHGVAGLDEPLAAQLLLKRDPHMRAWTVRLLGDRGRVSPVVARRFAELAAGDDSMVVRRQLACTAQRLPPGDALPIIAALARRGEDLEDPYVPLLTWWALERCAIPAREQVLADWSTPEVWQAQIASQVLLPRLVRRYAAEGTEAGAVACWRLLNAAPSAAARRPLLAALDEGLRARPAPANVPPALVSLVEADWRSGPDDETLSRLAARLNCQGARARLAARALVPDAPAETRLAMLGALAEVGDPADLPQLVSLLTADEKPAIVAAALAALARGSDPALAQAIIAASARLAPAERARARDVLLAKRVWARLLLEHVAQGKLDPREVPVEQLRVVAAHGDEQLDALVRKFWGTVRTATPEERLAVVRRLNNDLRAMSGDPQRGHELYRKQCSTCHTLFGEGEKLGPDLTHANRRDRDFLLVSIVDPGAVVRKEYTNFNVQTNDGRVLTGLIVEQDAGGLTLLTAKNERIRLARSQVEALDESPHSLMPENIVEQLTPQNLRDLFAWLQQPETTTGAP